VVAQRQPMFRDRPADDLVDGVVPPDVLPHRHRLTVGGEETGGMQPARARERLLRGPQPIGQAGQQLRGDGHRVVAEMPRRLRPDRVDAGLAADAAGTGRVEGPSRIGVGRRHPVGQHDVDHIVGVGRVRSGTELRGDDVAGVPDDSFGQQKTDGEINVVPGRTHRDSERPPRRFAVGARPNPDLERLLTRDRIHPPHGGSGREVDPDDLAPVGNPSHAPILPRPQPRRRDKTSKSEAPAVNGFRSARLLGLGSSRSAQLAATGGRMGRWLSGAGPCGQHGER